MPSHATRSSATKPKNQSKQASRIKVQSSSKQNQPTEGKDNKAERTGAECDISPCQVATQNILLESLSVETDKEKPKTNGLFFSIFEA